MSEIKFDYAQIGAVNLHYAKAGDGENLVILLHGFPNAGIRGGISLRL